MLKKLLIPIFVFVCFLLSACGKPSRMSDDTYEIGCRALEIVEKYNKAEIDADAAEARLHDCVSALENLTFDSNGRFGESPEIINDSVRIIVEMGEFDLRHDIGDMLNVELRLREELGK